MFQSSGGTSSLADPYTGMRAGPTCVRDAFGNADEACFDGALKNGVGAVILDSQPTFYCTMLVGKDSAALQDVQLDPEYYYSYGCKCIRGFVGNAPSCKEPEESIQFTASAQAGIRDMIGQVRLRKGQSLIIEIEPAAARTIYLNVDTFYTPPNATTTLDIFKGRSHDIYTQSPLQRFSHEQPLSLQTKQVMVPAGAAVLHFQTSSDDASTNFIEISYNASTTCAEGYEHEGAGCKKSEPKVLKKVHLPVVAGALAGTLLAFLLLSLVYYAAKDPERTKKVP